MDLYRQEGANIFKRSFWKGVASPGGFADELYPATGLEAVLLKYFAEGTLGEALNPVLIPSYEIEMRRPVFFKSWKPQHAGLLLREVARATSAAPTYFEPATIVSSALQQDLDPDTAGHNTFRFIDGGIFINSPALSAYVEARKLWPEETDIRILSLGTGELTRPIPFDDAKDWGKVGWMLPAMGCMFDGVSKAVDYQLKNFPGLQYVRIQGSLSHCSDDMDNASQGNLVNLANLATDLIAGHAAQLAQVAQWT